MTDPILEEVWRVREELLKRYGGIDGYFRHIQAVDRAHRRKAKARRSKRAGKTAHTNSTVTVAGRPTRKKAVHGTNRKAKRAMTA